VKGISRGTAVLLLAAAIRLVVAALVPLHPDEAFYWEWSRRLAAGYSEHPPMVALFIRAGTSLLGDTPLGVRLFMVLAGAAATWAVMRAAAHVGERAAGNVASVVFTALPVMAGAFLLATPDAPLLAFLALTLLYTTHALTSPSARAALAPWLLAGLCAGLAMASKYTGVLVPLAVLLAVILTPSLRHVLRTPGPYLAVLVASLVMLPVLRWNAAHDWVSFTSQIAHGLGQGQGSWWRRELDLLGGQVLLASPILFGLGMLVLRRGALGGGRVARLMTSTALVVGAFFVYAATRNRVEANWPAPAWIAVAVLLAIVPLSPRELKWRTWGVAVGIVFGAATYLQSLMPFVPLPAPRDPTARAYGWKDLAGGVSAAIVRTPGHWWIAANRYQDAAELAFNLPTHPPVFSVNLERRSNQYLLWPQFSELAQPGDDMLLVLFDRPPERENPVIAALTPMFTSVERGELVVLRRGTAEVGSRRLWRLRGWRGAWPPPPL
jgi:4-amino-4-deoxy-L-arabinose transferase-like glycosyltransferase